MDDKTATSKPVGVPRRTLMAWLTGVINAGVALAIAGPVGGFLAAPVFRKRERAQWIPILDDAELLEGQTRAVTYEVKVKDGYMMAKRAYSVFVARRSGEIIAFDPTCPHLGCHVEFKEKRQRFICPCHGGSFDATGKRVAGPPPRDLDRIAAKAEAGKIWLRRA